MLILRSFLAALLSILRWRAALELENLALRHQVGVSKVRGKTPEINPLGSPLWIGLPRLWRDWRSALGQRFGFHNFRHPLSH